MIEECCDISGCASQEASHSRIRTFSAETESVQVRAGAVVAAGTRGRAVGPVETGGTADGTVVALETEEKVFSFQLKQSWVNKLQREEADPCRES